jgi:hypothetical protein
LEILGGVGVSQVIRIAQQAPKNPLSGWAQGVDDILGGDLGARKGLKYLVAGIFFTVSAILDDMERRANFARNSGMLMSSTQVVVDVRRTLVTLPSYSSSCS